MQAMVTVFEREGKRKKGRGGGREERLKGRRKRRRKIRKGREKEERLFRQTVPAT